MRYQKMAAAVLTASLALWQMPFAASADGDVTVDLIYAQTDSGMAVVDCIMTYEGATCPYTGVEIPPVVDGSPVTTIAAEAFAECPSLLWLYVPASVTEIAANAFEDWSTIDVYGYPESHTEAFAQQYAQSFTPVIEFAIADGEATVTDAHLNVQYMVIPETYAGCPVTTIGSEAFAFCDEMLTVDIPETVTTIESYAFNECRALTALPITDRITSIGEGAFAYCTSVTALTLPQGMTAVPAYLCIGASALRSVRLPEGLRSISWDAFSYCTALCDINIPDTVTSIGARAFEANRSLTEIHIPPSVTSMYSSAFRDSYSVTIYGQAGSYAEEFAAAQGIPFVAEAIENLTGDVDGDGVIAIADAVLLHRCVTECADAALPVIPDINGDGLLDLNDVCAILSAISA